MLAGHGLVRRKTNPTRSSPSVRVSSIQAMRLDVVHDLGRRQALDALAGAYAAADVAGANVYQRRLHHILAQMTEYGRELIPIKGPPRPGDDHEVDGCQ